MNPLRYLKPQGTRYKNPPVVVHETEEEAAAAAGEEVAARGGKLYHTTGTPSMEPLMTGRVYLVGMPKAYDQLQEGDIANYRPSWQKDGHMVTHRLVQKTRDGWIGSGDNNKNSEVQSRVAADNYADVVATIHTYKGAENTRVAMKDYEAAHQPPADPSVQAVLEAMRRKQANAK